MVGLSYHERDLNFSLHFGFDCKKKDRTAHRMMSLRRFEYKNTKKIYLVSCIVRLAVVSTFKMRVTILRVFDKSENV